MPIKANQISPEVRVQDSQATPPLPGADQGIFYPKKFGDIVDACFKNNQGAEIRLTINGVPVGEANTASNVGSGTGLFSSKSGVELKFKSIKAGDGIAITSYDANTIQIASTVVAGEINDGENTGQLAPSDIYGGRDHYGVFSVKDPTSKRLQFKKFVPGQNIDIVERSGVLVISVSNLAQNIFTGSNVGTGEGNVFKEVSNNDFKFKRLKAGNNTTITETSTEITISSTGGVGSGESNTASNSAAGTGLGLFKQKVGTDLVFKKIKAGAGLALTSYDDDLEINLSGGLGESNTASNSTSGTGTGLLFKGKSGTDLVFRKLKAGAGVTLTTGTDDVTIDVTGGAGGGEANTTSSLGTISDGEGIAAAKNGVDLPFKRIKAGTNVTVAGTTNSVTVNATGDINAASNMGTGAGQVFQNKTGNTLQFKTIKAGANVTVSNDANEVTISAIGGGSGTAPDDTAYNATSWDGVTDTAPSKNAIRDKVVTMDASILVGTNHAASAHAPVGAEANTASNSASGTGTGLIFKAKSGVDLVFKKIKAGTGVTITNGTDDITIDASGGGGSSIQRYTASAVATEEVEVMATGLGVTYARSGTTGTFTVPAGVRLLSARLRLPMGTIGGTSFIVVYGTNGGSDLNTSFADFFPPTQQAWKETTSAQVASSSSFSAGKDRISISGLDSTASNIVKLVW